MRPLNDEMPTAWLYSTMGGARGERQGTAVPMPWPLPLQLAYIKFENCGVLLKRSQRTYQITVN